MHFLLRLPNWLGDLVMSTGALRALQTQCPSAPVDVIVRKELAELAPYLFQASKVFAFDRAAYRSLSKTYRYGRQLRSAKYTHYITLPGSFSTAWMGYATGAKARIGFRGEGRSFLLSHAYRRPQGLHRVEEYVHLLECFFRQKLPVPTPQLRLPAPPRPLLPLAPLRIALNFHSDNLSRTLPADISLAYIDKLAAFYKEAHFFFLGVTAQQNLCQGLINNRPALQARLHNYAGHTSLLQLGQLLAEVDVLISVDSGTAHLANSLGCPVVVFFGAGDEKNTRPYAPQQLKLLRAPGIPCAPCVSTICKWGIPRCLQAISAGELLAATETLLHEH